jgi:ATP-dependent helicase HrpA
LKNTHDYIKKIESLLPQVLAADRLAARREISRLVHRNKKLKPKYNVAQKFDRLQKRLEASEQKRNNRLKNLPDLRFNEQLPIFAKKDEIIDAIKRHPVIVVAGETGSGKTTQLPKFCLAAGRGIDGLVGCTQPRRIAATTVARRIAEELGQETGTAIGYKIRFKDRTADDAYIKVMTDGILLAETQSDRNLSAYDTIIVDEAHERSLNIDFILGILQTLLNKRDDLKLIITSATIDTEKFSKAFGNAPVIEVSGRMYPVDVHYLDPDEDRGENGELSHVDLAAAAASRLLKQTAGGDILVFMPTEQDIRETCELIEASKSPGVRVLPLFARLTAAEQNRVFGRFSRRKIIVATNVAETSITIPGIKYVIDSGLARISRYSPRTRTTSLPVTPVSKSSADQRQGRCGRVENGVCIRLFAEDDYQSRPQYTPPEIIRANLAEVILRMISLKLGDIAEFPFIDRPDLKNIKDGFNLLFELGAIARRAKGKAQRARRKGQEPGGCPVNSEVGMRKSERKQGDLRRRAGGRGPGAEDKGPGATDDGQPATGNADVTTAPATTSGRVELTAKGRIMARIPLDPRLSRMLIEAKNLGCIPEIAVIAAVLSIADPRERPAEKTSEADRMQAVFVDQNSDFVTLLNIWNRYHAHWQKVKSNNQMKRFCREHFISFKRMREWRDVHSQITALLREHKFWNAEAGMRKWEKGRRKSEGGRKKSEVGMRNAEFGMRNLAGDLSDEKYAAVHKSILSGFLSNIAQQKESNFFRAARGREVMIFPGSGLFNKAKRWVVAAEVVETSRVFARTVANIDDSWLENIGRDLCNYTYLNPHWEKKRGEVVALEQVSLFGLIIVADRKVSYGKVDPAGAAEIFIQSALINSDVKKPFAFMTHNQKLIDGIRDVENRFRRRDILISEPELFSFYQQKLPDIYDMQTLSKFLKKKGNDRFLRLDRDQLIRYDPDEAAIAQFPDRVELAGHPFNCAYVFDPGKKNDGVTVKIPAALASSVPAEAIDWLVPGLYPGKIEGLIKGLPKSYRKRLVPVKDTVEIICREMPKTEGSLISALGKFIYRRFGVDIPATAWSDETLPDHLKMRISVTAPDGKELRVGRDPSILQHEAAGSAGCDEFEALRRKWEKDGLTAWDFGDLPDHVSETGKLRAKWIAYPALEKDPGADNRVNLRLFQQRDAARAAHRVGVLTLYSIHFAKDLKFLKRQLILPAAQSSLADYFGGARQFEKRLYQQCVQTLFSKDIRSQTDFYAHAQKMGPQILTRGRELLKNTLPVLTAYHEARSQIFRFQAGDRVNPKIQALFQELIDGLERLVPENFVELYKKDRHIHLVRYIKALMTRAQRAPLDFEKDRAKATEVRKFADGLDRLLNALSPAVSDEKRQTIEDYFWMLEEYKVSVFAQELKTAIPISAKRLKDQLGQIERMI